MPTQLILEQIKPDEGDLMQSLPFLYGDKERLTQVLINLIKNALKHTSRGSIKIQASFNFIDS